MPETPVDLAAARARISRAHTEIGEVAAAVRGRWRRTHAPADLIISAALDDAERLADEVERLRVAVNPVKADAVKRLVGSVTRLVRIERDDARAAISRVRDLADRLGRESHPTHDHLCPDDLRAELLAALDGPAVSEQTGSGNKPSRRNVHCSNCGDTRGGPIGHEISECTWRNGA